MKKKIFALLAAVLLVLACALPASAQTQMPRVIDDAGLLTRSQESELLARLDGIAAELECDVVVLTVSDLGGKTPEAYADDFYDYNGFGFGDGHDGMLLLVCMGTRDWHISTTGFCITAFDDAGIEYISEKFVPELSDGDYDGAFMTYADVCEQFIAQARTGEPYSAGNMPREPFSPWWIPGSMLLGALPAWMVTGNMKSQLKPKRTVIAPMQYSRVLDSSFVTLANELFLGHNVTRSLRQTSTGGGGTSTHIGSSGTIHGGGGGKF